MMTDAEVGGLLTGLMTDAVPEQSRDAVRAAALKLRLQSAESVLSCTLAQGKAALEQCGTLLPEAEGEEIAGVVMAGVANKNPAVVELCAEGDKLRVRATAKEGLIRQGTARKAIKKLRAAL